MQSPPAPFSCQFSPNLPELLLQLGCTIAISTYQAGKVVFISPKDDQQLVQLPRTFPKAMGIALQGDNMAIATKDEVIVLRNSPDLAAHYPNKPHTYDALFMPRATFYTGQIDIHDLHFGNRGLWAVNTSFSCLCLIDTAYSFRPVWQPPFVDALVAEDRCHLNGLAMDGGEPRYVSALGSGNTVQAWRKNIVQGGVIMDVATNEIVAHSLPMPHTPRLYDGKLYCLLSAAEALICLDPATGKHDVVCKIGGFVRGMARIGDYVMIATSRLRKNSSTFSHLAIAEKANVAGITVVHLPTGAKVAQLQYLAGVEEIYDVQILSGITRPNLLNTLTDQHKHGLATPSATYWAAPAPDA